MTRTGFLAIREDDGTLTDHDLWKQILTDEDDDLWDGDEPTPNVLDSIDAIPATSESMDAIAAADFDESQHPRADDGKFTSGSGGSQSPAESPHIEAIRERLLRQPVVKYHGTSQQALAAIKKDGLVPAKGRGADAWAQEVDPLGYAMTLAGRPASVYMIDNPSVATTFAEYAAEATHSKPVVLEVKLPADVAPQLQYDDQTNNAEQFGAVKFSGTIKPEWITQVGEPQGNVLNSGPYRARVPGGFHWRKFAEATGKTFYVVLFTEHDAAALADFDESLHPRADDGKFTDGGSSGSGTGSNSSAGRLDAGKGGAVQDVAPHRPEAKPVRFVRRGAQAYNASHGLAPIREGHYVPVDPAFAQRIAAAYDALPEVDDSPETRDAYAALGKEIQKQWNFAEKAMGMQFEAWTKDGQPYQNSREMRDDVEKNKHLFFFTGGDEHPFLNAKDAHGLSLNDKFRAVHDLFGHSAEDYQFGPRGEENAWLKHSQMFSPSAQRALTTETRGQNSFVNYGKQNYNSDGTPKNIPPRDRPFAKQKSALLPTWASDWKILIDGETRRVGRGDSVAAREPRLEDDRAGAPRFEGNVLSSSEGDRREVAAEISGRLLLGSEGQSSQRDQERTLSRGRGISERSDRSRDSMGTEQQSEIHAAVSKAQSEGARRAVRPDAVGYSDTGDVSSARHSAGIRFEQAEEQQSEHRQDSSGAGLRERQRGDRVVAREQLKARLDDRRDGVSVSVAAENAVVVLADFDESLHPRDDDGRFTDGATPNERGVPKLLDALRVHGGGFTYHQSTGKQPTPGYVVSILKGRERTFDADKVNARDLVAYMRDNWNLLRKRGNYFGGWNDRGKAYLDVSRVVESEADAEALATMHGQEAYFDVKAGKAVYLKKSLSDVYTSSSGDA